MVISGYYFGILKRAVQVLTGMTGIYIEPFHITDKGNNIERIEFKVNWQAKGAVNPDEAERFGSNLQKASDIARFLNYRNFEIDYVKQENIINRCITDDVDLCMQYILNADEKKLKILLMGAVPAQDEYEIEEETEYEY